MQRLRMQTLGAGEGVYPTLRAVNVHKRMRLGKPAARETDALTAKTHIQERRLVAVMIGIAPEVVQLFPLKFVLDPLAIGGVPD